MKTDTPDVAAIWAWWREVDGVEEDTRQSILTLCDYAEQLEESQRRLSLALVWALGELNSPAGESDPLFGCHYDVSRETLRPFVGESRYQALRRLAALVLPEKGGE